MRMSICILGPSRGAVSGVATHLNLLFSSDLADKFELVQFQVGSEGRKEAWLGKAWRLITGPVAFSVFLLRHRPDVVHLNTSLNHKSYWRDLLFMQIAWLLRRKIVFQKHGGPLPNQFFPGSRFLTGMLRMALRMPDVIVVLGHEELSAYRRFVPEQRVEVVPNAVHLKQSNRAIDKAPNGPLRLAYLGRFAASKGIFEIVDAFAHLLAQHRNLRLTLAGSGPDEAQLRTRVCEIGLVDRIHFAGPLFGDAKDALWRESDAFVFPTHHEGLPYALLEAMAAGVVPVTTSVGAIPDVMQDGVHGLFVPPKDVMAVAGAIARLDDDRALLLRLAQASRVRVLDHYVSDRLADNFARIYMSLAATGKHK